MEKIALEGRTDGFAVLTSTPRSEAAVMTLKPGEKTGGPDNRHRGKDQWLYVRSGSGEATIEGETVAIAAGDLVLIAADETHEIRCTGEQPLVTFSVYAPPEYSGNG